MWKYNIVSIHHLAFHKSCIFPDACWLQSQLRLPHPGIVWDIMRTPWCRRNYWKTTGVVTCQKSIRGGFWLLWIQLMVYVLMWLEAVYRLYIQQKRHHRPHQKKQQITTPPYRLMNYSTTTKDIHGQSKPTNMCEWAMCEWALTVVTRRIHVWGRRPMRWGDQ